MRIDVNNIEELVKFFKIEQELYLLFREEEFANYIDYKIRERLGIHKKTDLTGFNKIKVYLGKKYTSKSSNYTNSKLLQMGYDVLNEIYQNGINKNLKLFINPN